MTITVRDKEMLHFCRFHIAAGSPDPSTKLGAAMQIGRTTLFARNAPVKGFFADHITTDQLEQQLSNFTREERLLVMVHAEEALLLQAGTHAEGATLYVAAAMTCSHCAKLVAAAGVKRVVALGWGDPVEDVLRAQWERWECAKALELLRRCGVRVDLLRNPG